MFLLVFHPLTTPVVIPCRKNADVVFVIDSTYNLNYQDFTTHVLATVEDIIRSLDVYSGKIRVAVVQYTNQATVRVPFSNAIHLQSSGVVG